MITADHGNDPTWPGSDYTKEYVPLLIYSHSLYNTGVLEDQSNFATILQQY